MSARDSISASACCNSRAVARSITLSGGFFSVMRATCARIATSTRVVEAIAMCVKLGHYLSTLSIQHGRTKVSVPHELEVDRRFARLGNRRQRIARSFFFLYPLFFVADNVEQQLLIFSARQILFTVFLVCAIIQWFAGFAMIFLSSPASDVAIEVQVRSVELLFTRLQEGIQALDQSRDFFTIEMAVVVVQVVEIGGLIVFEFVIAT